MKLMWTGTDVLYRLRNPKGTRLRFKVKLIIERIIVNLLQYFIEGNYVVSQHLADELKKTGIKKNIRVVVDFPSCHYTCKKETTNTCGLYPPKKNHDGFNVVYYRPKKKNQEFIDWLYGYDIVKVIKNKYTKLNYIELDGSQDMTKIYPITDFYLRPNRHDGEPRMIMECKCLGIPYYHSKSVPDVGHIIDKLRGTK